VVRGIHLPLVAFFLLSAVSFVPLGQLLAARLQVFQRGGRPLAGYASDILGSLVGVIGFAGLSFTRAAPPWWFAVPLGAGLVFFRARRGAVLGFAAAAALVLGIIHRADRADYYSPYYALRVAHLPREVAPAILANGSLHQYYFHLRRTESEDALINGGYHLPYRYLGRPPGRVLVLGAGTGNDVAVALDEGATQVDAVEIDPVILDLGRLHPDRPYDSPRVRRFNTDARTFLNESTAQYDLIVFGTLDSMTRLSALSNVRLDNFVYTRECLEAARARLAPDGGVVMYFMTTVEYINQRLEGLLTATFQQPPRVLTGSYYVFNRIYLDGPAYDHLDGVRRRAAMPWFRSWLATVELPRDDWPYLYLQSRGISGFYLGLIGVFALLAVAAVAAVSREMRRSFVRVEIDTDMFLFGAAFLLLETKSVTTMSLLWGATWLTSAVVFGSILAMVLAATLLTQWRPLPWTWCMGGLIAALLAAYLVPVDALLRMNGWSRLGVSFAFVGTPIFFAAACFALLFRDRPEADTAFGWNLLGAVAGGLVEFLSMITGMRALYLLVLAAYLGVVLRRARARNHPAPQMLTVSSARTGGSPGRR